MCQRFHCLPSQLLNEDAEFLRLLALEELSGQGVGGSGERS
jgi:hypothetical protein